MEGRDVPTNILQTLQGESEAIYRILMNILKGWQPETEEKKGGLAAETVTLNLNDLRETVILSPEGLNKYPVSEKVEKSQESLSETVIITPQRADDETLTSSPRALTKDAGKKGNPGSGEMDVKEHEDPDFLTETVILNPEKPQGPLSETVIVTPQKADGEALTSSPRTLSKDMGEKDNSGSSEMDVEEPEDQEFLSETVILNPEKLQDPLSETVIITPQKADDETLTSSPRALTKDAGEQDNSGCSEKDAKEPEESDFLAKTVILKPGKSRDKENDDSQTKLIQIETITKEIRVIYNSDISNAETLIKAYLEQRLKGYSESDRLEFLEEVTLHFRCFSPKPETTLEFEQEELSRLFSLLLGKKISMPDLSSTETMQKLINSLNTVFDTINQIIHVMNNKLLGKEAQQDETIRGAIGSNLEKGGSPGTYDSLQGYLDQIQDAFLIAHQAFQQATQTRVKQILDELDPKRISALSQGGYKFGPSRKAEFFEVYKEEFKACKAWFESERFTNELLREFEKICQKSYNKNTKNI